MYAEDQYGEFVIAVEAKADEPFGETVAEALASAVERRLENPRSNGVQRIVDLATALLSVRERDEPRLGVLRYQLLTATAGALAEAERKSARRVILLVHEFITDLTSDEKHQANAVDLDRFARRIFRGGPPGVLAGHLYGPASVPGQPLLASPAQLFVGKAIRNLRHAA